MNQNMMVSSIFVVLFLYYKYFSRFCFLRCNNKEKKKKGIIFSPHKFIDCRQSFFSYFFFFLFFPQSQFNDRKTFEIEKVRTFESSKVSKKSSKIKVKDPQNYLSINFCYNINLMSYFPPYASYYQAWNSDPQENLNYYPYMYYVNHFNESFFSPAPFSQPQQNREFGSAQKIKLEAPINHEDNISAVKVENKQEKSPELRVNSQSSMKKEKRQPTKEQKKTKVRFSKQVLTKSFNDDDFKLNQRKKEESHCQKEGRNRNSNLFRAFIKLLLTKTYHQNLFETFSNIANSNNIKLSFENFISLLQKKAPAFTNYINNKEFRNLYNGEQEFNQVFRIMFKKFLKQEGITHILTISYKDRMKRDSISQFLDSLHGVQFDRKPKKPTRF